MRIPVSCAGCSAGPPGQYEHPDRTVPHPSTPDAGVLNALSLR
jgi:hypothetical protein